MFIHRKLTTTCCVAVLALGLVACGSSDDDTSMTDPTTIEPMDSTAAEQLANAQAAVADAETMVAALDADSSHSDRAAAYAALAEAQSVLAEASGIPENEIALLRAEIARLQGDIDQAKLDAQVEADRIAAEMATEATRIAALVAGTKEAETKRTAITDEAEQMADADAGLGGSVADNGESTYLMAITRDRDGTTIKITDTAIMGEDGPKFVKFMDLGNGRTMHTRTMEADAGGNVVTEVVIVSTDIEEPEATAFAMVHALTVNPETANEMDFQSISFSDVGDVPAALVTLVKSSVFTAGTGTKETDLTFDFDDTLTDDMDEAFETAGTYNGAMGTYRCDGVADCTVMFDAEGAIEMMSAGWIFTPAMGATSDVADANYLHYGFWLQKTADEDGVLTYDEVETFAGSSVDGMVEGSGDVTMVTGSATYNGGATGVYVHSEVNSDGSRVATTAGQFAAEATLTAHFGGDDIAVNKQDTLTGTIDNFALENDEEQQWSVALKGDIQDAADGDTPAGSAAGSANGGGAAGTFSATFHGPTVEGDDMDVQPSSVVGEFGANFNNGSVAGAFGARK